ncbi:MAG: MGMT family protein [Balneolaceae bacterium]|nr:MGMT family protein [Balneolaceae bacterium]
MPAISDTYERIYRLVQQVPSGYVTTYGAIARRVGAVSKARLVGYALNKLLTMPPGSTFTDLTVPAHRVVNRLGQCTGRRFFPGDSMIERLQQEGVTFVQEDKVDFENHYWDDFREG